MEFFFPPHWPIARARSWQVGNKFLFIFTALYLKIEGAARCMWTVSKGNGFVFVTDRVCANRWFALSSGAGSRRRSVTYAGREDYLNQTTYLLGSQSGSAALEMPPGTTTYSFACVLPMQLPSSVEGKYGNIRYNCKAVLDRPWKTDKEFRLSFTVIKTEDLNLLSPTLYIPSKSEIVRHFYCCCFKSKPFSMSASIPFAG